MTAKICRIHQCNT